jgi:multidrug transporter EmrE-like cation transporter
MSLKEFLLLLAAVISSVLGQIFLKFGALKLGKVTADNIFNHIINMILIPELIMGLAFYGLGAIVYILLLTRVNLSVAGPSASLIYVFTVLIGYFLFNETIPFSRSIGLGLIICGVILVAWQN